MIPARETLDDLSSAPEDDAISVRDLTDPSDGHFDAFGKRLEDGLGRGDQELVVLSTGGRQHLRVASEGLHELPRIFSHR